MSASDDDFGSGLLDSNANLDYETLAERAVGTIYYGLILGFVGVIEFVTGGLSTGLRSLASGLRDVIGAVYLGGPDSSGISGAIAAGGSAMDWFLALLGPLGYPASILITMGLGYAVIRMTIYAGEVVLGRSS